MLVKDLVNCIQVLTFTASRVTELSCVERIACRGRICDNHYMKKCGLSCYYYSTKIC